MLTANIKCTPKIALNSIFGSGICTLSYIHHTAAMQRGYESFIPTYMTMDLPIGNILNDFIFGICFSFLFYTFSNFSHQFY